MEKKHLHKIIPAVLFVVAIAIVVSAIRTEMRREKTAAIRRVFPIMGTIAEIKLYGGQDKLAEAADAAQGKLREIEDVCNIFDPKSELSRLNASASRQPFKCGDILWDVFRQAEFFHKLSDGSFDVTVKPLMDLWGFYRKRDRMPSEKEIHDVLSLVGFDKIALDGSNKTVSFTVEGMAADFGGIAKGYAVDKAVRAALDNGADGGLINLGGNIFCFGIPPPGKKFYTIGVRHPVRNDDVCGTVDVVGRALATSGNYERYVILEGKHLTHIIDPKTGRPVENMLSATILSDSALWADALSTSVFINGADFARKMHDMYPGIDILVIIRNSAGEDEVHKIGAIWGNCAM